MAFTCLQVAIALAPRPLGSHRPWALAVLETIVWVSLLVGLMGRALATSAEPASEAGQGARASWPHPRAALIPFLALIGFLALQVLQLVPGLATTAARSRSTLSPRAGTADHAVYLSVRSRSLVAITVQTSERVSSLLATLVAAGVLRAMAAVAFYSTGAHYTLFFTNFDQGNRATATFPNRDHLAAYMEVTLSAVLGWLLSQFRGGEPSSAGGWRTTVVTVLGFVMSGKMLLRLLMVMMVIALVMTHSRMGNGAFFIGIVFIGLAIAVRSPRLRRAAMWLVASMIVIDVLIIGQWVGARPAGDPFQSTAETTATASGFGNAPTAQPGGQYREESIQDRLRVPRLSVAAVMDRPWLGHGSGTYADAFRPSSRAARATSRCTGATRTTITCSSPPTPGCWGSRCGPAWLLRRWSAPSGCWVSGGTPSRSSQEWTEAHDALATALAIAPDDPELSDRLGDLYTVAGQRDWRNVSLRKAAFREAADRYRQMIDLRPGEPAA